MTGSGFRGQGLKEGLGKTRTLPEVYSLRASGNRGPAGGVGATRGARPTATRYHPHGRRLRHAISMSTASSGRVARGTVSTSGPEIAHFVLEPGRDPVILCAGQPRRGSPGPGKPAKEAKRMLQAPNKAGPEDRAGVERPLSPNPSPPGPSGDDGAESKFLSVSAQLASEFHAKV